MSKATAQLVAILLLFTATARVLMEVAVTKNPPSIAQLPKEVTVDVEIATPTPTVARKVPSKKSVGRCSNTRFITYGNMKKSRHFNRLMSFIGALALADRLGRTVVLAEAEGGGVDTDIRNTYDMSILSQRYCFVDTLPKITNKTTGCMIMKGTKTNLNQCTETSKVRSKLVWNDVNTAAYELNTNDVLYIPLTIYLNEMIDTFCIWKYLYPVPSIKLQVEDISRKLHPYMAIHLRSLETSCEDRVRKKNLPEKAQQIMTQQCTMTPAYVAGLQKVANITKLYIADDGQRPAVTSALTNKFDTSTYKGTNGLHIDFWMLVEADYFIGNQMSTLSMNACMARRGRGRLCNNFVGKTSKEVPCAN
eukprot:TRINITY_DN22612_c0_g1_i1.p1 TRINITY_DN22612_c0_g1~~TRINITY_DN22612_c0_g1_i1.p1  ORF type:complete len:363 (+),score=44.81 TRINITY_DN22612_c0_g1_i1:140-1228(+)